MSRFVLVVNLCLQQVVLGPEDLQIIGDLNKFAFTFNTEESSDKESRLFVSSIKSLGRGLKPVILIKSGLLHQSILNLHLYRFYCGCTGIY